MDFRPDSSPAASSSASPRPFPGQRPQLLLADEPTGQLDSATSGEHHELIAGIHAQGRTVILVTHERKPPTTPRGRSLSMMAVCAFIDFFRQSWRICRMAATAIWAYKLRSFFVVAGVALGIASLTVIVASVDGAQRKAFEIVKFFGPDAASSSAETSRAGPSASAP